MMLMSLSSLPLPLLLLLSLMVSSPLSAVVTASAGGSFAPFGSVVRLRARSSPFSWRKSASSMNKYSEEDRFVPALFGFDFDFDVVVVVDAGGSLEASLAASSLFVALVADSGLLSSFSFSISVSVSFSSFSIWFSFSFSSCSSSDSASFPDSSAMTVTPNPPEARAFPLDRITRNIRHRRRFGVHGNDDDDDDDEAESSGCLSSRMHMIGRSARKECSPPPSASSSSSSLFFSLFFSLLFWWMPSPAVVASLPFSTEEESPLDSASTAMGVASSVVASKVIQTKE
mmetsp:Transcript_17719/g.49065  ORF Transcript_17719/g.49065 Transcript_17719/m.49065 type:complete len:286 (-) Transcript_17719:125-982(-)